MDSLDFCVLISLMGFIVLCYVILNYIVVFFTKRSLWSYLKEIYVWLTGKSKVIPTQNSAVNANTNKVNEGVEKSHRRAVAEAHLQETLPIDKSSDNVGGYVDVSVVEQKHLLQTDVHHSAHP